MDYRVAVIRQILGGGRSLTGTIWMLTNDVIEPDACAEPSGRNQTRDRLVAVLRHRRHRRTFMRHTADKKLKLEASCPGYAAPNGLDERSFFGSNRSRRGAGRWVSSTG